ncbi:methyl-accepting chemotaxis protein [Evansella sp. AB-rgal1]|uniref:methyl-accepting chemotaxis protein n=1 Tax=Evansella sp. AB-rgal1 TaxID=3242696 RepID=UPI00359ED919
MKKFYRDLSIKWKLSFVFGSIFLFFLAGFIFVFMQFLSIDKNVTTLNDTSESAIIVSQIGSEFRSKYIQVSDYIINGTYREDFYQERDQQLVAYIHQVESNLHTEEMRTMHQQILENNDVFNELVYKIVSNNNEHLLPQLIDVRRNNNEIIMELVDLMRDEANAVQESTNTIISNSLKGSIVIVGLILLIGLITVILFSRSIITKLKSVTDTAKAISSGDLQVNDIKNDSHDELGDLSRAINEMKSSLRMIITNISSSAQQVASTSEELSASSEETSKATEEISSSVQEIANGSELQVESSNKATKSGKEIVEGIEQISTRTLNVSRSSLDTSNSANSGQEVIEQAIHQMEEINKNTHDSSHLINNLGDKSKEIGSIISLITGVAEQTNLLALNAAIEAARAGEHGRGFAVVADEVRKLAEQTTSSSSDIRHLIDEIQAGIDKSVISINGVQSSVNDGIGLVKEAGQSFKQIVTSVDGVSLQIEEISKLVKKITDKSETMLSDINETNHVAKEASGYTQTVAASSEQQSATMQEITATATNLSKMAEELQILVEKFKY